MPRHKISKADLKELPVLTEQQMEFAKLVGLEGLSYSEAYRRSYHTENTQENVIWKNASTLAANGNVKVWINHLRLNAAVTFRTHAKHVERMNHLGEVAYQSGDIATAIKAEENIGKACGHYVSLSADVTREPARIISDLAALVGEDTAQAVMDAIAGNKAKLIEHEATEHPAAD